MEFNMRQTQRKKAQFVDILYIVFIVVAMILGLFAYKYIDSTLKTALFNNVTMDNTSTEAYTEVSNTTFGLVDWIPLVAYIMYTIAVAGLTFLVRGNPLFVVLLFVSVLIVAFLAFAFQDAVQGFVETTLFSGYRTELPITMWVLSNLPIMLIVSSFFCIIMLFVNV
jgi:hypothetical protein